MKTRPYRDADWAEWLRMSMALFHSAAEDHTNDMRAFSQRSDAQVFIAERDDGSVAGFVEVGARDYADGCDTSPVGYIEAWYVDPDVRRRGFGRALLKAAETWANERGYQELASDAELDNAISRAAHGRAGFEEVEQIAQFRKRLPARASEGGLTPMGRGFAPLAVLELYGKWGDAFHRQDIDAVIALLTPDYMLWIPGKPPIGADALRSALAQAFESFHILPYFEREGLIESADMVIDFGWDVQRITPKGGGEPREQRQRVVLVLRRDSDGEWKFSRGIAQP